MKPAAVSAVVLGAAFAFGVPALAQTPAKSAYKAPRAYDGHADLSGNWSNASLTPISRAPEFGERLVYTPQEVARLEGAMADEVQRGNANIDPNHPIPKVGGDGPQAITRQEYIRAAGVVGGYDRGWLDPGAGVMRVGGQPRTSILTTPNGRPPARKPGASAAVEANPYRSEAPPRPGQDPENVGPVNNPEDRPLGERCIIGFGRNGGPPMLSNGFYNNNYQIVQTKDAVSINTEMVHDTRIIRIGGPHRTDGVRPWFGDSVGHWEGDTLVVETTNIPERQAMEGAWRDLKVTERFTRVGERRLLYQFSVESPTTWDKPWGGEYEFAALNGRVMEYACHEGNYALEGVLAGARQAESDARRVAANPAPAGR